MGAGELSWLGGVGVAPQQKINVLPLHLQMCIANWLLRKYELNKRHNTRLLGCRPPAYPTGLLARGWYVVVGGNYFIHVSLSRSFIIVSFIHSFPLMGVFVLYVNYTRGSPARCF